MKIKNFINLKIGKRSIDFHNLILDEYLERFVKAQLDVNTGNLAPNLRKLRTLYLKLDTPLEFDATSKLDPFASFDIALPINLDEFSQNISDKTITAKYIYSAKERVYNLSTRQYESISNYYGRNITALGFNALFAVLRLGGYTCSILNTSNYNISFEENQDFVLTRRDTISTDADFWSNDSRIKGPIHLSVDGGPSLLYQDPLFTEHAGGSVSSVVPQPTYAQLYSVGFSSYKDYIDKEYVIGQDIEAVNNGTSISLSGLENVLSNELIFPNEIYPSNSIYPLKANYKYVIYKYKLFQEIYSRNPSYVEGGDEDEFISTWTDTGAYYYQSMPLNLEGNIDLRIKYERS